MTPNGTDEQPWWSGLLHREGPLVKGVTDMGRGGEPVRFSDRARRTRAPVGTARTARAVSGRQPRLNGEPIATSWQAVPTRLRTPASGGRPAVRASSVQLLSALRQLRELFGPTCPGCSHCEQNARPFPVVAAIRALNCTSEPAESEAGGLPRRGERCAGKILVSGADADDDERHGARLCPRGILAVPARSRVRRVLSLTRILRRSPSRAALS